MTTYLLIRHGNNDMIDRGVLIGRTPGISLNADGRRQAAALAEHLAALPIRAVYSSPMERTRETAAPLSERLGRSVQILEPINEVDFGEWTGWDFDQLSADPRWKAYRAFRSSSRIPGGEMLLQVQQRMIAALETLRARHERDMVALFSHGDPIRTVVAHCLGIPLDLIKRLRISTASISVVDRTPRGVRVLCVNHVAAGGTFPIDQ
jgi:probable phosphomutase (TIGR03848 family)